MNLMKISSKVIYICCSIIFLFRK